MNGRFKTTRSGIRQWLTAALLGLFNLCVPRDNPYDPGNPEFIMSNFCCNVHVRAESSMDNVGSGVILFEYKGEYDSITADSSGDAQVCIAANIPAPRISVKIHSINSYTHRLAAPCDIVLSRDGRDTTILLRDLSAQAVAWDTLLTKADSSGATLVWHGSSAEKFLFYRLVRSDPMTQTTDTIKISTNRDDTLFFDSVVEENRLYVYRIDVGSMEGIVKKGAELSLMIANRSPGPSDIISVSGDVFVYLRISWTTNNNTDFGRYIVYRSADSVSYAEVFSTSIRNDTTWLDTTVSEAARRYYYYIETIDAAGLSSKGEAGSGVNRTTLDSGLAFVPGGPFIMGRNSGPDIPLNQQPAHTVTLSPYLIDRYEVTVERYVEFLNNGNPEHYHDSMTSAGIIRNGSAFTFSPSKKSHPITWLSWSDADAFCRFAGGKLPTEAQWEKASRGTEGRLYPWGNSFYIGQTPPDFFLANYVAGFVSKDDFGYSYDGARYTAPTGNYPTATSIWGVYDMAGNVSEWCNDWYANSFPQESFDPQGPLLGLWRSYRGGSYKNYPEELISTSRYRLDPSQRSDDLGCRCVYENQ